VLHRERNFRCISNDGPPSSKFFLACKHCVLLQALQSEDGAEEQRDALLAQVLALVLPERQRQVLTLLSLGWSYERIARELGIAVGTVKTHVFRARNNPDVSKILLL